MAQQTINIGASPNDGTGTPLRTAFQYTNSNFSELYTAVGPSGNNIVVPGNATITGDLTVDTSTLKVDSANNRVGIGTASPAVLFHAALPAATFGEVGRFYDSSGNGISFTANASSGFNQITSTGAQPLIVNVNSSERYRIASDGVATWSNVGGVAGTAMTLNSTGLGVGTSPSYNIDVLGATLPTISVRSTLAGASNARLYLECAGANSGHITYNRSLQALTLGANGGTTAQVTLDSVGNVGIGVTPSAWGAGYKALQLGNGLSLMGSPLNGTIAGNAWFDGTNWKYITANPATLYYASFGANGSHVWSISSGVPSAGGNVSLTNAMTLDASGNLLVGTTTNTNLSRIFSRGTATSSALALQGASGDVALAQLTVGKFDNNTTTSQIFVRFTINDNSGGSGQINANGASQAAFGTFSDSRLKKNIVSLPSQLANILSLRPVEFDYKDGSGHQIGFVAQEVQDVYSDAVSEQAGFLTVTGWSKTEARLVSAIKELAAKVQALEAKLA